jgi:DNA-binding phage protein
MRTSRPWDDTFTEVASDPEFRKAFLAEAVNLLLEGDFQTGKSTLRRFINNTLGFEELAQLTDKHSTSLIRMFSDAGNPTAENLFSVIHVLQEREGMHCSKQKI